MPRRRRARLPRRRALGRERRARTPSLASAARAVLRRADGPAAPPPPPPPARRPMSTDPAVVAAAAAPRRPPSSSPRCRCSPRSRAVAARRGRRARARRSARRRRVAVPRGRRRRRALRRARRPPGDRRRGRRRDVIRELGRGARARRARAADRRAALGVGARGARQRSDRVDRDDVRASCSTPSPELSRALTRALPSSSRDAAAPRPARAPATGDGRPASRVDDGVPRPAIAGRLAERALAATVAVRRSTATRRAGAVDGERPAARGYGPLLDRAEAESDLVVLAAAASPATTTLDATSACSRPTAYSLVAAAATVAARSPRPELRGCELVAYDVAPGSGALAAWAEPLDPVETHALDPRRARRRHRAHGAAPGRPLGRRSCSPAAARGRSRTSA